MLSKKVVIAVFRSIRDDVPNSEIATTRVTRNSERTIRRYRRVLSGFDGGQTDFEIRCAVDNWAESSIASMRRWAIEEEIIPAVADDLELNKRSAEATHREALVEFAVMISESLDVPIPTVTAVSGIGEGHWDAPFRGLLGARPFLRVIELGDGPQNLTALCEHTPRKDLNLKIQGILSSLESYAQAAKQLGELIRRRLIDRGLFDDPGTVPHGLILAVLYFGVEDASAGTSSGVVPVVEPLSDGNSIVRIGGWAPRLGNSETAEAVVTIFGDLVHEVPELPVTGTLIKTRSNYEDLVKQLQSLIKPKHKLRIAIDNTSCSVCA